MIEVHEGGTSRSDSDFSFDEAARDRLSEVIRIIGSAVRAGEIAGVTDEQIRRWRDGKAKPSFGGIAALAYAAGKSLDWLATGREPMRSPDVAGSQVQVVEHESMPGFTLVPRLDVHASAGNGALAWSEEPVDFLAFQESWLRARNIHPKYARVLTTKGVSMEPTIHDGDVLLVDTSIDRLRDNSIYIVVYDGFVLVKRVHGRVDGSVMLISDNERYPPEIVPSHEVPNIHVAGRVMWFGRSI